MSIRPPPPWPQTRTITPPPTSTAHRFPLGTVRISTRAEATVSPHDVRTALDRHVRGDWGEHADEHTFQNDRALVRGDRVFSGYRTPSGTRFCILTLADRRTTMILLPEELSPSSP